MQKTLETWSYRIRSNQPLTFDQISSDQSINEADKNILETDEFLLGYSLVSIVRRV
jgi:hypothetical protein